MPRIRRLLPLVVVAGVLAGCQAPPDASFSVSPDGPHLTGDVLTFSENAGCSYVGDLKTSWDLDGDGKFETGGDPPNNGSGQTTNCSDRVVQHSYSRPGTYTVSADSGFESAIMGTITWLHGYSSQQVVIAARTQPGQNQPPTASFTSDANPGYTERPVHFDASGSSDPDGQIAKYEWDFTSDGTWDASGPTATYAFQSAGDYKTTLRVTDAQGAVGTTDRAVPVVDGVPPGESLAASGIATAARATRFSSTLSGRMTSTGQDYVNGRTLSSIGLTARGHMKLKGLPKPLARKRRAHWRARFTTRQRGSDARARVTAEGVLLLDFGHRDRVCFSGRVTGRLDKPLVGRVAVVGGSGVGRHVRGWARFVVPRTGRKVKGKLALAGNQKAHKLPKACRRLVRQK